MPSPFPGMNPYLERKEIWHDFHKGLVPAMAEQLGAQVLPNYFVKIDEHVFIREGESDVPLLVSTGNRLISEKTPFGSESETGTVSLEAPVEVEEDAFLDEERQSFLEIIDRESRNVVAVVELLSPTNKMPGPDRERFLRKRSEILFSNAHLVEIDLLRGGPRMPWRKMPKCDYCVVVSRVQNRPRAGLWPINLRDPLPVVPVPLKEGDGDAKLDLQPLIHRIYDSAGYQYYIYDREPEPPLEGEDLQWAKGIIAETR